MKIKYISFILILILFSEYCCAKSFEINYFFNIKSDIQVDNDTVFIDLTIKNISSDTIFLNNDYWILDQAEEKTSFIFYFKPGSLSNSLRFLPKNCDADKKMGDLHGMEYIFLAPEIIKLEPKESLNVRFKYFCQMMAFPPDAYKAEITFYYITDNEFNWLAELMSFDLSKAVTKKESINFDFTGDKFLLCASSASDNSIDDISIEEKYLRLIRMVFKNNMARFCLDIE